MAKYIRSLDPKRHKRLPTYNPKLAATGNKWQHQLVCRCPEAKEGEHECLALIHKDEVWGEKWLFASNKDRKRMMLDGYIPDDVEWWKMTLANY